MAMFKSVKLTYFDLGSKGRGEMFRLFFEDAGIPFEDERVAFDMTSWPAKKQEMLTAGVTVTGSLPVIQVDGQNYTHILPTLRHFSKMLGKYGGESDADIYLADQLTDSVGDLLNSWVQTVVGGDAAFNASYAATCLPGFLQIFVRFLAKHQGPFLLGDQFSYADIALHVVLFNNDLTVPGKLDDHSSLNAFVRAFEARPNIAAYLASTRRK